MACLPVLQRELVWQMFYFSDCADLATVESEGEGRSFNLSCNSLEQEGCACVWEAPGTPGMYH